MLHMDIPDNHRDSFYDGTVHVITQQSRDEMSERLKAKPFILLISDGMQDHASMEQEIVFLINSKADRVTVDVICVEHVEKADATGIYNAPDLGRFRLRNQRMIPTPIPESESESCVVSFGGVGIVVIGIGVGIVVTGIGQRTKALIAVSKSTHKVSSKHSHVRMSILFRVDCCTICISMYSIQACQLIQQWHSTLGLLQYAQERDCETNWSNMTQLSQLSPLMLSYNVMLPIGNTPPPLSVHQPMDSN